VLISGAPHSDADRRDRPMARAEYRLDYARPMDGSGAKRPRAHLPWHQHGGTGNARGAVRGNRAIRVHRPRARRGTARMDWAHPRRRPDDQAGGGPAILRTTQAAGVAKPPGREGNRAGVDWQLYFGLFLGHRVIADIRRLVFQRVQRWSLDRFAGWTSSDLITRSLQDTQVVQSALLVGLLDFIGTALTVAGITVMLFVLEWRLAVFTLVVIPLLLTAARLFGHEIQHVSQRAQERIANLASLLRQSFGGARVIRAFVQEEREIGRFLRENERTFHENL